MRDYTLDLKVSRRGGRWFDEAARMHCEVGVDRCRHFKTRRRRRVAAKIKIYTSRTPGVTSLSVSLEPRQVVLPHDRLDQLVAKDKPSNVSREEEKGD